MKKNASNIPSIKSFNELQHNLCHGRSQKVRLSGDCCGFVKEGSLPKAAKLICWGYYIKETGDIYSEMMQH